MAPVRIRHPKGVSTIQIPFDQDDYTVQDMQQAIYAAADILPSLQDLKSGYPPRSLTIVPELPLSSLGLKAGEQLIVSQKAAVRSPADSRSSALPSPSSAQPRNAVKTAPSSGGAAISKSSSSPNHVQTDSGVLVHRVVPDDNSCLFSSVALIFEQDPTKQLQMRQIVADGIRNDPLTYDEAILGGPPAEYISKILNPSTWGGAIELGIIATHYKTEIASIDVETGRTDHFPPKGASNDRGMRCVLIYSGIHYDAATLAPVVDAPADWHQTVFPIMSAANGKDAILVAAEKLATILRGKKAFTNTATFDLKCEECGQGLKGEKGARAHAEQTGHVRFGEY